jgi:predicted SAM-dependent methyltransferase
MGFRERVLNWVGSRVRDLGFEVRRLQAPPHAPAGDLDVPAGILGANYGCGSKLVPGWLNLDLGAPIAGSASAPFLAVNLASHHPFRAASFRRGYAEDFLEHLSQAQSLAFLSEAHRTLEPGGVLRLSFPGLEGVLRTHYRPGGFEAVAAGQWEAYDKWGHVHFYSREELRLVATHVGFRAVEFRAFRESPDPTLAAMDTRSDQADVNTIVELTK